MLAGALLALAAGLLWGLIFIVPLLVPDYPASLQSAGRYLALGLISLPLAWQARRQLARLQAGDWWQALRLSLVGNLVYFFCLASAVQRTGAPVTTMIIGTLPVAITLSANLLYRRQEGQLPWRRLGWALGLLAAGVLLVNRAELAAQGQMPPGYLQGGGLAFAAVACWTWYALKNARWLRDNPGRSPSSWATAQGLVTLPLSLAGYALAALQLHWSQPGFALLGPRPEIFVPLMLAIGLLCSWLGGLCWNGASQRLPTVLVGPLIVFESLAGLAYGFGLRQAWPPLETLLGMACLVAGVLVTMRAGPSARSEAAQQP
ncbi:DMT family transporter [Gallaecimonas kandeliae]|uniref:DMT family transporter n=1 Tax=Gallaecimonas kandeliae TaxID=3029055 RepID=UPI002649EC39|nr:DMT family transporter [Gallaecimonas kandeliae]WKE64821.1 DMT family transporter [Gallaecimonas kandeliae]